MDRVCVVMKISLLISLLLFLMSEVAKSQTIIRNLPGFDSDLPFTLETGYIGVGKLEDVQLFYYFIQSERSPRDDPLLLWLTGGPGCSAFSGLIYENLGPLKFNYEKSSGGSEPTFELNPYSWTKVANIIFLDQPVGSGFSYANNWEGYKVNDTLSTRETYEFLRKWLIGHPEFLSNELYISGDSYGGKVAPIIVHLISEGIEEGHEPRMNLKGYIIGNPVTDESRDKNGRVKFAFFKSLISRRLYESTKRNCKGDYVNVDPSNVACIDDLRSVAKCVEYIASNQILEPDCSLLYGKPPILELDQRTVSDSIDILSSRSQSPQPWCRGYHYVLSSIWANKRTVQKALHVREGTIKEWVRCNKSLDYTKDVTSSFEYHLNLTRKGYRVLIFSGDHDMLIPYLGTQEWIEDLNLTISYDWRPWFLDGQVAGYAYEYTYNTYSLTYATVLGAGHTAPEYKPEQCFAMLQRWLAYYYL